MSHGSAVAAAATTPVVAEASAVVVMAEIGTAIATASRLAASKRVRRLIRGIKDIKPSVLAGMFLDGRCTDRRSAS